MTRVASDDLDDLLAAVTPPVAQLIRAVDALVRSADPEVVGVYWPHQRTAGYGVGPKKMSEHYAYLAAYDRHINVGFNYGAQLDDRGLLTGSGKSMRSRTIRDIGDLDDPRFVELLQAARQERLTALGRT